MPKRRLSQFHEREVARALRAARKAGEPIDRVEIDPQTGRISVIIAKPGETQDDTPERIISKL